LLDWLCILAGCRQPVLGNACCSPKWPGLSLQGTSTVEQAKARGSVEVRGSTGVGRQPMAALIPDRAAVH
jgi:hypothetical protein